MFVTVIQALFFFLPAYAANMAPVITAKLFRGFFKKPLLGRKKLWGESVFGKGKTWGGLFSGVTSGVLIAFIQWLLYARFPKTQWLYLFDYGNFGKVLILGLLLGCGALLGDLAKSFVKRRLHIKQGRPFIPFDQLDFLIGGLLFGALLYVPPYEHLIWLFLLTPWLHFGTNVLAFFTKLKKIWW